MSGSTYWDVARCAWVPCPSPVPAAAADRQQVSLPDQREGSTTGADAPGEPEVAGTASPAPGG